MNWKDIFDYKEDGTLCWKESELKRNNVSKNISPDRVAGYSDNGKNAKTPYIPIRYMGKVYLSHRIVWEMHNGSIPKGMQIDHIDGNGSNNKIENLRIVTGAENLKNKSKYRNNKSGVVGVSWDKASQKWHSYISDNGKRKSLGFFSEKCDAISARKHAESVLGYHANHGR